MSVNRQARLRVRVAVLASAVVASSVTSTGPASAATQSETLNPATISVAAWDIFTSGNPTLPVPSGNSVTFPYTGPTPNTVYVAGIANVGETFSPTKFIGDTCVAITALSHTVTGTPAAAGWANIAINTRTGRLIPVLGHPTWGGSIQQWSVSSGYSAGPIGDTSSTWVDASLEYGAVTNQPSSGQYSVSTDLALADASGSSLTGADLAAGSIQLAQIVVSYNYANGLADILNDVTLTYTTDDSACGFRVSSISPAAGPTNGGQSVTIRGFGFAAGDTVTTNGNACVDVVVVDANTITCTTGSNGGAEAFNANVVVAHSGGETATGGTGLYSYVNYLGDTQMTYTGNQFFPAAPATISATLAASVAGAACYANRADISIYVDLNGDGTFGNSVGEVLTTTATTDANGVISYDWAAPPSSVYDVQVAFPGTSLCGASSASSTLTVGSSGDNAAGGGWYNGANPGKSNFGFTVQLRTPKSGDTTAKGQLLWEVQSKSKFKGVVTQYAKQKCPTKPAVPGATPGVCAAFQGVGDWSTWSNSKKGWTQKVSGTVFTVWILDGGYTVKKNNGGTVQNADCFWIQIGSSAPFVYVDGANMAVTNKGNVIIR